MTLRLSTAGDGVPRTDCVPIEGRGADTGARGLYTCCWDLRGGRTRAVAARSYQTGTGGDTMTRPDRRAARGRLQITARPMGAGWGGGGVQRYGEQSPPRGAAGKDR